MARTKKNQKYTRTTLFDHSWTHGNKDGRHVFPSAYRRPAYLPTKYSADENNCAARAAFWTKVGNELREGFVFAFSIV